MRRLFYALPLLGLLMTSCSSDDNIMGGEDFANESSAKNFLSVSMVSASGSGSGPKSVAPAGLGTRAGDYNQPEDDGDAYRDGTKEENNVKSVRFFFFYDNGSAAPARKLSGSGDNVYASYIDWYPSEAENNGGPNHSETVEKILQTTLSISTPDKDKMPTQVLAILNPTSDVLKLNTTPTEVKEGDDVKYTLAGPTLKDLQAVVKDFKTGLQKNNFVMSNSVYVNDTQGGSNEIIYTTKLTEANFQTSLEEAEQEGNQVNIYVERVLARLDFAINMEGTEAGTSEPKKTIYNVNKNNKGYTIDDATTATDVYINILGWNITGTPAKSRLTKEVASTWTTENLFGSSSATPWNAYGYHRSFWALNYEGLTAPTLTSSSKTSGYKEGEDGGYLFGNFGEGTTEDSDYPANAYKEAGTVYLQENANNYSAEKTPAEPDYKTKVIIAAQLVDKDGNALDLAKWGNKLYKTETLKKTIAGGQLSDLYFKTTANGETSYTPITGDDLTFKTAAELNKEMEAEGNNYGRYYVYVVLTEAAKAKSWVKKDNDTYTDISTEDLDKQIRNDVPHAMVWNNGYTYYFFDVRHLGNTGSVGYEGIVRNHIYDTKVTSIAGLGTPVYNPGETIYPEKPEDEDNIVSAKINILSWRVVSQNYDLVW